MRAPTLVPADQTDRNIFLFEDLQNANMSDATSEAAAECQANACGTWGLLLPGNPRQAATEGLYRTNDPV